MSKMNTTVRPLDKVLPQLRKVRQYQPAQWGACCPAHDDNSPSLSVRETPDGAVLLKCFAGCEVAAIVAALGLEVAELFPPNTSRYPPDQAAVRARTKHRLPRLLTASQALALLYTEAMVMTASGGSMVRGKTLSEADHQRMMQAMGRITYIYSEANPA
jgi:hypothetical protein